MANRFRIILFLFLSVFSLSSFASFPASGTGWKIANPGYSSPVFGSLSDAAASAMNTWDSSWPGYGGTCSPVVSSSNSLSASCNIVCTIRPCSGSFVFTAASLSCPSNATLLGNQCACNSGYAEKNGACETPDACESLLSACEAIAGHTDVLFLKRAPGGAFKSCTPAGLVAGCSKGCAIQSSGVGAYYKDQSGVWHYEGKGTLIAETCTPSPDSSGETPEEDENPLPPSKPDEKPCKSGEYPGQVNGTKVCLPASSKQSEHTTTETENSDGSKTDSKTTTTCENGICTSTTITTDKDASGNVTNTSSSTTTQVETDFCARNPGNPLCSGGSGNGKGDDEDKEEKGSGSFGGSCSTGFQCEGDAATCAIAKEQYRVNCEFFDPNELYSDIFEKAKGSGFGVDSIEFDLSTQLDFDPIIGAGSCPVDIEVDVFGHSIPVKLSDYCPYFAMLGNLLVLGATIGCFRILGSA